MMCNNFTLALKILTAMSLGANTTIAASGVVEPPDHKKRRRSTAASGGGAEDEDLKLVHLGADSGVNVTPSLLTTQQTGNAAGADCSTCHGAEEKCCQQDAQQHAAALHKQDLTGFGGRESSCATGASSAPTANSPAAARATTRSTELDFDLANSLQEEDHPLQPYLLHGFLRTRRDYGKLAQVSKEVGTALQLAERSLAKKGQNVYEPFRSSRELNYTVTLWWTDSYRKRRHGYPDKDYNPKKYEDLRNEAEVKYGPVEQWDVGLLESLPEFCRLKRQPWKQMYLPSFRISHWRTRGIESMQYVFSDCKGFNQPLHWDTSTVQEMASMFECSDFNDPSISSWNVSKVVNMSIMFYEATSFNQNLGSWNLSPDLEDARFMFHGAAAFDQNLYAWGWGPAVARLVGFDGLWNTIVSRRLRIVANDLNPGVTCFHPSGAFWLEEDCWRRAFALPLDRVLERIP